MLDLNTLNTREPNDLLRSSTVRLQSSRDSRLGGHRAPATRDTSDTGPKMGSPSKEAVHSLRRMGVVFQIDLSCQGRLISADCWSFSYAFTGGTGYPIEPPLESYNAKLKLFGHLSMNWFPSRGPSLIGVLSATCQLKSLWRIEVQPSMSSFTHVHFYSRLSVNPPKKGPIIPDSKEMVHFGSFLQAVFACFG